MKLCLLACLPALMLLASSVRAEDNVAVDARLQLESRQASNARLYGIDDETRRVLALDARGQFAGPLESIVRAVASARDESDGKATATLNELSLDIAVGVGFATVGKKVLSWDVGYAFRPLDVVQQQDRRALNAPTLKGVPLLAWEVFDATRALTVVLSNPGHRKAEQPRDDGAVALRLYKRNADSARDEYLVLRLSDRNGVEGGASFSQVEGEALEIHGSVLLQQRHDIPLSAQYSASGLPLLPARWESAGGGVKALAGMTWTTEGKFSVLAEAWLDRSAQRQKNLLLRGAQNWDDTDLSADLLWMPEDGGRVTSMALDWKHGPWRMSASVRDFGGKPKSLVRASPVRRAAYLSLNYAF
jgi:hypothetical protein